MVPFWRGARVLVVDNKPPVRQLVRRILEAEGFHVKRLRTVSPR
jgi:CheY-like chemotaxis protein